MWKPEYSAKFKALCGSQAVLDAPSQKLVYASDALGFHQGEPDCVVIPQTADQLKGIVDLARELDIPYVARGAGTGLSGGAIASQGGLVIHLSKLKSILEIHPDDFYCVVEPGVVHQRLNDALQEHGLFYPPDPSSGFACTLGGNIAENAGGIRCFKYGVAASYLLGVEFLTVSGELVKLGGPAGGLGATQGLDWKRLLCGSEGMLGVMTKLWLRLRPIPEATRTFLASFQDLRSTADCIVDVVHQPDTPVACEMMDRNTVQLVESSPMAVGLEKGSWALLVEINGPSSLVEAQAPKFEALFKFHGATQVRTTADPIERLKLWKARKVAGGLTGQISPDVMVQDAVIPRSKIHEVLELIYKETEARDIPSVTIFHAGDGNLHPNFLFDARKEGDLKKVKELSRQLMQTVADLGGSLSGEHGIGADKMEFMPLMLGPAEMKLHEQVLTLFNPHHQLNPGKVFPNRNFTGCCAAEKSV